MAPRSEPSSSLGPSLAGLVRSLFTSRRSQGASVSMKSGGKTAAGTEYVPDDSPFNRSNKVATGGGGSNGGSSGGGKGGGGGGGGGGEEAKGSPSLWSAYLKALERHPVLSKGATAALTNMIGDLVAQAVTKGPEEPFHLDRTAKFTVLGFVLIGPLLHNWYGLLSRAVTWKGPSAVAAKVFLDRAFFAPVMIAAVFGATLAMEGKAHLLRRKLEADWWPTVLANWSVWIPSQAANFTLMPTNLQVLWAQSFALLWKVYLSYRAHLAVAGPAVPPQAPPPPPKTKK